VLSHSSSGNGGGCESRVASETAASKGGTQSGPPAIARRRAQLLDRQLSCACLRAKWPGPAVHIPARPSSIN